ncbi:MAG TPA: nickel pincer cofactor biosynthesis protein LarC [Nitrososphaera sp.]|nr:nickel pincer cofactor biosynthesis protein LarC [Nitrososphaera sp.]
MSKAVVIDSQVAGIAGDMLVSALVDAGASASKVTEAIFACQKALKGSKVTRVNFVKVISHGFAATRLDLECSDRVHERRGSEMQKALAQICESLGMEKKAKAFALNSLKTIISAEAHIHGEKSDSVHLHEASSIDTLADLVGTATALQDLKLFDAKIFSTSVAVGGGLLKFSHGTTPNPAAAILEIFKGRKFNLTGGPAATELTTPTGAAMLVNLAPEGSIANYPGMMPEAVGYGSGTKQFEGFANVVRVLLGSLSSTTGNASAMLKDMVCVIETNVDDASGELMGNVIDSLSQMVKDVTVIPGMTKKGRPSYLIRIISEKGQLDDVLQLLFAESGTLGARVQEVERIVLPRTVLTVPVTLRDNTFNVHVKVAKDPLTGRIISVKPEFEDIKIIASRIQMSVKRTMEIVNAQVLEKNREQDQQ